MRLDDLLQPVAGEKVSVGNRGSWEGDTIAIGVAPAKVVLLAIQDDKLALKDIIALRYPKLRLTTPLDPMLNADGSKMFLVTHEGATESEFERTAVITYDLASGACTRWIAPDRPAITNLVFNPSRPR
jgi:hypothetical protein